jgi:hypothetical protein
MLEGVNVNMVYLIHCKNIHKCYNVSPTSTAIKNGKKQTKQNNQCKKDNRMAQLVEVLPNK